MEEGTEGNERREEGGREEPPLQIKNGSRSPAGILCHWKLRVNQLQFWTLLTNWREASGGKKWSQRLTVNWSDGVRLSDDRPRRVIVMRLLLIFAISLRRYDFNVIIIRFLFVYGIRAFYVSQMLLISWSVNCDFLPTVSINSYAMNECTLSLQYIHCVPSVLRHLPFVQYGALNWYRISPPRFLTDCRKRRQNQDSWLCLLCLVD